MDMMLRCTGGPCAGETITIEAELVLGREQPDPGRCGGDSRLSRRHARVFIDDAGRPAVEDFRSTNGTWVNERRIADTCPVQSGDVLRVGQTTFEVEIPVVASATRIDTAVPTAAATVAQAPPLRARLLVVSGPKEGEEIPLEDELLIGRGYGEPGSLGGDRRLSRRHARIARGPGGVFYVEDTGSSNGTTINNLRLRGAHSIKDGDEIGVGSSRLEARDLPRVPLGPFPPAAFPPPGAPLPPPGAPLPPVGSPPVPPAIPAGWGGAPGAGAAAPLDGAPAAPFAAPYVPQGAAGARLSSRRGRVIGVFAAVFAIAAIAAVAVVVLVAPLGTRSCPSGFVCQKPLTAPPLQAARTFTGSLGWRVEYDASSAVPMTTNAAGNELSLRESSFYDKHVLGISTNGTIAVLIRGFRAAQVTPQAAIGQLESTIKSHLVGAVTAPDSDQLFVKPVLGFHPATGEVLEGNVQTPQGPGPLVKLAVISAASGGVTVAIAIVYPVQTGDTQQKNPDRPFDSFGDQILGTVRFPSDGAT